MDTSLTLEMQILRALRGRTQPVGAVHLKFAAKPPVDATIEEINKRLQYLERNGYVVRFAMGCTGSWQLSPVGEALLKEDAEPVQATVPERPADEERDPEHGEERVHEPDTALLCVDEDELDDWWDNLDVEAKADAFVQWSLGNDGRNSHVYIERHVSVPIVGSAGESAEQWNEKASRLAPESDPKVIARLNEAIRGPLSQADGCGSGGPQ